MVGHSSHHSPSPDRHQGPYRRSPSRRERSPVQHRSTRRGTSPAREKRFTRAMSPKSEMYQSPSPPVRHKTSYRETSPFGKEKNNSRARSPKREKSRSSSPRTKRLRRAQANRDTDNVADGERGRNHVKVDNKGAFRERESERTSEREHERNHRKDDDRGLRRERETKKYVEVDHESNHGRGREKSRHRETGADREAGGEKKGRRSGRDENESKSSRTRHERSTSPLHHHNRSRHRSLSPEVAADRREHDEVEKRAERRNGDDDSLAKMKAAEEDIEAKQKQKPSFELSGKLAAETNRVRGVTLLFTEPPDGRKPDVRWRLYVFKGGDVLNEPLYIHRQSCYLFGRERRVADIPTDHPSCSKQHAVIQFRQAEKEQSDGTLSKQVRPYLMDLGSTNKTFLNDNPIEPQRYYELFEKDTIKFGNSRRIRVHHAYIFDREVVVGLLRMIPYSVAGFVFSSMGVLIIAGFGFFLNGSPNIVMDR